MGVVGAVGVVEDAAVGAVLTQTDMLLVRRELFAHGTAKRETNGCTADMMSFLGRIPLVLSRSLV